jgi:hypothetical protein
MSDKEQLMTQEELAHRWQISEATLERNRSMKQGVKFMKLGGLIRYRLSDVLAYEGQSIIETNGGNHD